jgi:RecB family exonuclease
MVQKTVGARQPDASIEASTASEAPLSLSFSAIDSYRECPRQYWYRHVQKLPAKQSAEAVHGVIVHEVLQQIGLAMQRGEKVSMALVRRLHDEVWTRSRFPDVRREPTFRKLSLEQLRRYVEAGGFTTKPVHVERDFVTEVDGWTLRGVIDRIDKVDTGWTIVDYKSGRKSSRSRRDLQVALYALGAKSALWLEPLSLEVVYLASAETVKVEVSDSLIDEARRAGGEVAAGVRGGRFEARPSWKCRLCPYRLACAEAL